MDDDARDDDEDDDDDDDAMDDDDDDDDDDDATGRDGRGTRAIERAMATREGGAKKNRGARIAKPSIDATIVGGACVVALAGRARAGGRCCATPSRAQIRARERASKDEYRSIYDTKRRSKHP